MNLTPLLSSDCQLFVICSTDFKGDPQARWQTRKSRSTPTSFLHATAKRYSTMASPTQMACQASSTGPSNPILPIWTQVGIAKSVLSISSPGTYLSTDMAPTRALAREIMEYAANVKRQPPDRLGFFASLPLPDIRAAVEEVGYAMDVLDADSFVLHSNTAAIYLGYPVLHRVLAEFDARRTVVFIHPTAACHHNHKHDSPSERYLTSSPLAPHYRASLFEFFFDSARSLLDPRHNPPLPPHPLPNLPQRGRPPLPPRRDDSNSSTRQSFTSLLLATAFLSLKRILREC